MFVCVCFDCLFRILKKSLRRGDLSSEHCWPWKSWSPCPKRAVKTWHWRRACCVKRMVGFRDASLLKKKGKKKSQEKKKWKSFFSAYLTGLPKKYSDMARTRMSTNIRPSEWRLNTLASYWTQPILSKLWFPMKIFQRAMNKNIKQQGCCFSFSPLWPH